MNYNFSEKVLNKLDDIEINNKLYYQFKKVNFYVKWNNNTKKENLIVGLHGSLSFNRKSKTKLTPLPVFRGYNWKYKNFDILCISDKLLKDFENKRLELSWYLGKYNKEIYLEILNHFKKIYKKIIFIGGSGGGLPSFYFASKLNQYCILQNSQLYLENYHYYDEMLNITKLNKNDLDHNIEIIIKKYGVPKYCFIFQNKNDNYHLEKHLNKFIKYKKRKLKNININIFDGSDPPEGKTHHHINFPSNLKMKFLLRKITRLK